MKKLVLTLTAIAMMIGFSNDLMAQTAASVNNVSAEAVIIKAFTLTQTSKLNFAYLATSSTAGTCTLNGAASRAVTGGVTTSGGTASVPSFDVTGGNNSAYTITVPADDVVTIVCGSESMKVNGFKAYKTIAPNTNITGSTLSATGTDNFVVGATLEVGANQVAGTYTGTFTVSVDYN